MQTQEITDLIRAAFPDAELDVSFDGHHHTVMIADASFEGQSRVAQQRAVYAALKGKMDGSSGELHALAINTRVPG